MRVLYVNPFSQQVCGPDESLLALLAELIPLGVEAHVVLPAPGPHVDRYLRVGAAVHFAPLSVLSRGMGKLGTAAYPWKLGRGALAVRRLARHVGADLIHSNMEVVLDGAIAAKLLRVPHVFHYRGNTLDRPRRVFDALTWTWTRLSGRVFCISGSTATVFRKRGYDAGVEVVYNPIDLSAFGSARRSDALRAELGAGPDDVLVGTVGRIHPRKDVETFLRAGAALAARFPRIKLAVIGPAEAPSELAYLPRVQALATALGIADRLCLAGARRDIPAVMKSLDVFVLCSRHEGFGRVVAEALACGTPAVLTREGALPELVEDGRFGLLAAPEDGPGFAEAIGSILADPALRTRLSVDGPRAAARFDGRRIAEQVLSVYRALVAAPAHAGAV